jgi:membrane protein implicated in regulation of membrane protease activity
MMISLSYLWLGAGILFLLAEALGVSGVGLMFAGLGAITVGVILSFELIAAEATLMQFIAFFITSAAWTLLLWKPLQKFRLSQRSGGYSNMVGDTAYIGSHGLARGETGEASWSGTIMKAQLAPDAGAEKLEGGAPVIITDVTGNTLIVKPKA